MATVTSGSLFTWFSQLYHHDLGELHRECIEKLSDLGISREALTVRLYEIVERALPQDDLIEVTDPRIPKLLRELNVPDLYLSMAARRKNPRALDLFSRTYGPTALELCRLYCKSAESARQLARLVFGPVLLQPPTQANSDFFLASYDGRSTLSGWIKALLACRIARSRLASGNSSSLFGGKGKLLSMKRSPSGAFPTLDPSLLVSFPDKDRLVTILTAGLGLPSKAVARFFLLKPRGLKDMVRPVIEALQDAARDASAMRGGREGAAPADGTAADPYEAAMVLAPRERHALREACSGPSILAAHMEGRLTCKEEDDHSKRALVCRECLARTEEVIRILDRVTCPGRGPIAPVRRLRNAVKTVLCTHFL